MYLNVWYNYSLHGLGQNVFFYTQVPEESDVTKTKLN